MPLPIPDNDDVIHRAKLDVQRELGGGDPFARDSFMRGVVVGYANRVHDFYHWVEAIVLSVLPGTATGAWLELWASWWNVNRLAATGASGYVVVTGDPGLHGVGRAKHLVAADGSEYVVKNISFIYDQEFAVASITRSGSTATLTTQGDHTLASNVPVTIAGADQAEYNVSDAEITVTGSDTFTYEVSGAPASPATGSTITASTSSHNEIEVGAAEYGAASNRDLDTALTFQTPISGVDDVAHVGWDGLTGGADQETNDALRARFLYKLRHPVAHFNANDIDAKLKEVNGITRVFVDEIDDEGTPAVGCVTVYFMRDNDDSPIPSAGEVATAVAKLAEIIPANTDPDDVNVLAPDAHTVDFAFAAVSPDTSSMRAAVEATLAQFAAEYPEPGLDIIEDAYKSPIWNTVDPGTGEKIANYTLSSPSGTISVAAGDIFILGDINWT
jgi:uncharacterized phage protein gp47/JayE